MSKEHFVMHLDYGDLLEMRKNLQKRYASGIMSRYDYETQMHKIDKIIADSERGRRTGKVI
jgi:hypothetical protein